MTPPILRLDSLDLTSVDQAGVKASRLGFLLANGFAVPDGYCILQSAYQEHLKRAGAQAGHRHGSTVQGRGAGIVGTPLDGKLRAEIGRICSRLGGKGVAVRSSSTAEDLSTRSFAGIYESILGVNAEDCAGAVLRVWASYWDAAARTARQAACLEDSSGGMAVIVQRMISPRFAGVVFTADPREGLEDRLAIEVVAGMGDALVDGTEQGRCIGVRRDGLACTEPGPFPVPDRLLKNLAATALRIEALFGTPQDIEWCVDESSRLWILQARPITGQVCERVLLRAGWERAYDDPFSPFGRQLAIRRHARWVEAVNRRYGTSFQSEVRDAGGFLYLRTPWRQAGRLTRWRMGLAKLATWCRFRTVRDNYLECKSALEHFLKTSEESDLLRLTDRDLFHQFRRASQRYLDLQAESYPMVELVKVCCSLLNSFCKRYLPPNLDVSGLLTGLDNPTVEHDLELAGLAARLRDGIHAEQLRQLEDAPFDKAADLINSAIGVHAERFLARHGYLWADRYPRDPAWRLNRSSFLRAVAAEAVRHDGGLAEFHRRQKDERAANIARARELLKSRPILSRTFDLLLARATEAFPAKEERNEQVYLAVMAIRRLGLEIGARLCATRLLETAEDVFLMEEDEIRQAFLGPDSGTRFWQLLNTRRAEDRRARAKLRVTAQPEPTDFSSAIRTELVGEPCSPGVAFGPARLVGSFDQLGRVRTGDIVVCRQLRPAWSTVLSRAAGVAVEKGALLSHGATLAREYGIPAVMNIAGLFQSVAEGVTLRVDGNQGVITVRHPAGVQDPQDVSSQVSPVGREKGFESA